MDIEGIRRHWAGWASAYGIGLKATTKTWTIKALEIDALSRRLRALAADRHLARVLEVGCGNGINCVELAKRFPNLRLDGIDYVEAMVASAIKNGRSFGVHDRVRFFAGDVLRVAEIAELESAYDVVFTDRCLINLNTFELQKQAITALVSKLQLGGYLVMIENSRLPYNAQNRCREALGLAARTPAAFNLFFDEAAIRPHLNAAGLDLIDVEDFGSLHDIMLYVLVPAINGGVVDYDHPLVEAATSLSLAISAEAPNAFGAFGQNRMFICRRTH
jgi:predicted O-methyltransferase YrrM